MSSIFFLVAPLIIFVLVVYKVSYRDEYTEDGIFIRTRSGLTEVPTDIPSGAKQVSLQDNRIAVIRKNAFSELSECTRLFMNDNWLNEIEAGAFSGLINLHMLHIYNNDLKEIRSDMWMGLNFLKRLSLGNNELEDLPAGAFVGLNNLEELSLAYNDLKQVRGGMFEGLFALQELYLHSNDITSLEPGAFTNLPHLNWLLLGYNDLETLEMRAFLDPSCPDKHPSDMFLSLEWNTMQCDESLCWLKEAERKNWIELDYITVSPVTCGNYPRGTNWKDINLNCTQL